MPRMGKTEEDWNGLKLGFLKTVQSNSFSKLISAVCNFKYNDQETYLFVSNLWFCHSHVISLLTLSSIAITGEQLAKLNKMNWTAVTQPLKRTSWNYLPWVVVNPSGSKYMAIFLSNIFVTLFQLENRSKAKFEALWGCPPGGDVPNWHSFFHKCNRIISI